MWSTDRQTELQTLAKQYTSSSKGDIKKMLFYCCFKRLCKLKSIEKTLQPHIQVVPNQCLLAV
jgi:hypothetical protein